MASTKKPTNDEAPAARKAAGSKRAATRRAATGTTATRTPAKKAPGRRAAAQPTAKAAVSATASVGRTGTASTARTKKPTLATLRALAREVLGIEEFRPGQEEGLKHVLAGRDVLAVMPTGSGKSLLYQLPSMVLPGLTVVVSPLIALIKDQVDKMRAKGVVALRLDSTLTPRQQREVMELATQPGGKLLLTTPERMADPVFRKKLAQALGSGTVSLFVVDEAHCVSQWGHDFRPSYLVLRQAIEELGRPPVLATTATAPPHVRDDILHQLGIPRAKIVTTSFERPNLHFEVIAVPGEDEKKKVLLALLKKLKRPGIVYCATVKAVEQLSEELSRHGVPVASYHGRMTKKERDREQGRFMEPGSKLVMIATNAFGLGVDKPDIRYVLHYHVPGSLEQYVQEAGRAGRDGKPARCVLLFSPDDVAIQEYFLTGTYPSRKQVMAVFDALAAWRGERTETGEARLPTLKELALSSEVGATRTRTILALLKEEGWVVEERGGRFRLAEPPPAREAVSERAKDYDQRRMADRRRLEALLEYVRWEGCRTQMILEYLGEKKADRCGRCDNDLRSAAEARAAAERAARLEHEIENLTAAIEGPEPEPEGPGRKGRARTRVISLDVAPAETVPATAQGAAEPVAVEEAAYPGEREAPEERAQGEKPGRETAEEAGEEVEEVEEIETTAAELAAAEGGGEAAEITVLKRKKRPKPLREPKAAPTAVEVGARKKKRRRRRKRKKSVLPPRSAFTSPVLVIEPRPAPTPVGEAAPVAGAVPSGAGAPGAPAPAEAATGKAEGEAVSPAGTVAPAPATDGALRPAPALAPAPGRTLGPIVEYVRRPMKIAAAPVASATPNDVPRKRRRRGRRGAEGGPGWRFAPPQPIPPSSLPPPAAGNHDAGVPGSGKKKRRRRRRRKGGGGGLATSGFWMPASGPKGPPPHSDMPGESPSSWHGERPTSSHGDLPAGSPPPRHGDVPAGLTSPHGDLPAGPPHASRGGTADAQPTPGGGSTPPGEAWVGRRRRRRRRRHRGRVEGAPAPGLGENAGHAPGGPNAKNGANVSHAAGVAPSPKEANAAPRPPVSDDAGSMHRPDSSDERRASHRTSASDDANASAPQEGAPAPASLVHREDGLD